MQDPNGNNPLLDAGINLLTSTLKSAAKSYATRRAADFAVSATNQVTDYLQDSLNTADQYLASGQIKAQNYFKKYSLGRVFDSYDYNNPPHRFDYWLHKPKVQPTSTYNPFHRQS